MGFLADQGAAIQSKSFDVWRRLYTRFQLEPGPSVIGGVPEVGTSIIPVTQVDDLLRTAKVQVSGITDLSGGGAFAKRMLTVPTGKRWRVTTVHRTATTGGTRVLIINKPGVSVNVSAVGTSEEMVVIGEALILDEGWSIGMRETGDGADTAELVQATFTEEDAF